MRHPARYLALFITVVSLGLSAGVSATISREAHAAAPSSAAHAPNLQMLTLHSNALGGKTGVAVLLPDGYTPGGQQYPVLYLLAGHGATHWQWLTNGDTMPLAKSLHVILVMPDAYAGWYSNPLNGSGPRWEDYIIDELIPYVDAHYRTVAGRTGRAVAGLSMGGYGAFELAARHPDLFVAAASFSGNLNLTLLQTTTWLAFFPTLTSIFGDPRTHALYWTGHDPVDLASNLRGIRLYLSSGNGAPGPFDGTRRSSDPGEEDAHTGLLDMEAVLRSDRISATVDDWGAGTHTWPYFKLGLHHALPLILGAFAHPPAPPMPWSYRTIDDRFTVWGYHVARTGAPEGWIELRDVSAAGLTASGAGILTVTTAPLYHAGVSYRVTGGVQPAVMSDAAGRLQLQIRLLGMASPRHVTIAPGS